jgi:hypothetical protein
MVQGEHVTMKFRILPGVTGKVAEMEHKPLSPPDLLHVLAVHLKAMNVEGFIDSIHTQEHPDNEGEYITTITWSHPT